MRRGHPVLLVDDFDRENEADLIVAAEKLTSSSMAMLIRECSGIVCLCLAGRGTGSPAPATDGDQQREPLSHGLHRQH